MQINSSTISKFGFVFLCGLTICLIVSVALLASVPPVSRDALTHHLAVPKVYIQQGSMSEIPHMPFSYYPMNLDLLYIIPMYFGNDILPKYIHFSFGLLTACLIYVFLRKRLGTFYALFAVLFFLSLPIIVKLSITVYVDLGLIFFSAGALIFLLVWIESKFEIKYLIISAIFCGLALGTKYNGLIVLLLLTSFSCFLYSRAKREEKFSQLKAIGTAGLYLTIALIVFSPWMIRNILWTGNPIYPLYNQYFHKASTVDTEEVSSELKKEINYQVGHWNHFAIRRMMFKETWGEIALIPIRIFFQGRDDQPQYFDGKLNPFLLILPLLVFVSLSTNQSVQKQGVQVMWIFVCLFILMAFLRTSIRIRYIAPVIPPLIILSAIGLHNLVNYFAARNRLLFGRILLSIIVLTALGMNAFYMFNQFRIVDPVSYISGEIGRDEYITYRRPEYPVIKFANQNLDSNHVMLGLFMGNRSYYSDRILVFDEKWFTKTIRQSESAKEIVDNLISNEYTHLLVNMDITKQWSKTFERPDQVKIANFFNHNVRAIAKNTPYALFEITPLSR